MTPYYWQTERSHANNSITMSDFLENHLPEDYHVVAQDGSYAEIQSIHDAEIYAVHASGNGDFTHHVVQFEKIS